MRAREGRLTLVPKYQTTAEVTGLWEEGRVRDIVSWVIY